MTRGQNTGLSNISLRVQDIIKSRSLKKQPPIECLGKFPYGHREEKVVGREQ